MRVLFLIWNYWPGIEGGSERQARQVAAELEKRGHHCTIWTAWQETHLPKKDVKDRTDIIRLGRWVPWQEKARRVLARLHRFLQENIVRWSPESGKSYDVFKRHFDFWALLPIVYITRYSFMREVRKELENASRLPDIIHLHEPSWLGGFVAQLATPKNIPVLCQEATNPPLPILGYDVPDRKGNERHRRCAHFIAMAPYLVKGLLEQGVIERHIHLLPNGVKIPVLAATRRESPVVLYVGNFSQGTHWKAFDVLFDAWKIVSEYQHDLRLIVLGGGDRSYWEKYVEELGCSHSINFMGQVANPENYYESAAIFVLPSRVEGMSNALLEAQSWGLPCVVSEIPGNTAIVKDGVNGLVVPVNDAQALAAAIMRLGCDRALRKKTGKAARKLMQDEYAADDVIDRLVRIYENILAMKTVQ
jgi:glycosyltransferase involved in cell wall biosynthesis